MAKPCSILDCGRPTKAKGYCISHYERLLQHGDPLGGRTSPGEPMRWIHEVALFHTSEGCLHWPYGKYDNGYGTVKSDGKNVPASRYVCELAHGAPPTPEHEAAHNCGKGHEGCIAPGHLEWKTHAENMADKLIHGTHNRGERHTLAKLTEDDVRIILSLKDTETQASLAKRFGVCRHNIAHIHTGRSWAWLSDLSNTRSQSSPGL